MFKPSFNRKSQRLESHGYTYGTMFITICINKHKMKLGKIVDFKMQLSPFGKDVQRYWEQIDIEGLSVLEFVVMPNHIHLLLDLNNIPLGDIIRQFKTLTTLQYINGVREGLFPRFEKRLWQRNYFDHIVRDTKDFLRIEEYIKNNPAQWQHDKFNS